MANEDRHILRFEALKTDDLLRRFHARFCWQEDRLKEQELEIAALKASLGGLRLRRHHIGRRLML